MPNAKKIVEEHQELTRRVADLAPSILYVYDLVEERNVWGNRETLVTLGYGLAELAALGPTPLEKLLHPDDKPAYGRHRERLLSLADGAVAELEYRLRRADGSWCWLQSRDMVFCRDGDGRVRQIVGAAVEIGARVRAEQHLRDSEERYRRLVSVLTDVALTTDATGAFAEPQEAWQRYTGQTWQEARGFGWIEAIHIDDRERVKETWTAAVRARTSYQIRGRLWHAASQGYRHVLSRAAPILSAQGEVREYVGSCTDIHERVIAEAELAASEARARTALTELEAIYQTAAVGLCVLDRDLRYVRINDRLAEVNGISAAAHIGRTVRDVVPAFADNAERIARGVFATGVPARDVELVGETQADLSRQRVWLEQWFPLVRDGEVTGVNVVVEEITARREAEREREDLFRIAERARAETESNRELLERVQLIIEGTVGATTLDELLTVLLDLVRGTLGTDTATVLLRGESEEDDEILHVRASVGLHEQPLDPVFVPVGKGFAGRIAATRAPLVIEDVRPADVESSHIVQKGLRSLAGVPLTVDGRVIGVLHVGAFVPRSFRNDEIQLLQLAADRISVAVVRTLAVQARLSAERAVRESLEALHEANRRKDEFLAMLAHELRAPLAPVRNAAHVLRTLGGNEPRLRTATDIIERQVTHMARLIDDLLDVSRITRGKITLRKERLSLSSVIAAAVEAARPELERHEHTLAVNVVDNVFVEADRARLTQIITNLLANAAKFTPAGGHINVRSSQTADGVAVSVRDNGIGISKEAQGRIFELFQQEDVSIERSRGGLGIGLTLVKRLVDLHGGDVGVQSDGVGHGAEFIVTLPMCGGESLVEDQAAEKSERLRKGACRILVVEDNEDAAESFRMLLELNGHVVEVARDGLDALRRIAEFNPEVAFVDLGLPIVDGFDVADRVRSVGGPRPVLVAISGYGRDEDKQRAKEAGFDEHMTKPVNFEQVERLLLGLRGRLLSPERSESLH